MDLINARFAVAPFVRGVYHAQENTIYTGDRSWCYVLRLLEFERGIEIIYDLEIGTRRAKIESV